MYLTLSPVQEITDRRNCSPEEITSLKQFLQPRVPQLVQFIRAGAVVSKGRITSCRDLAKINTEWYNLGEIWSRKKYNLKFYRIDQIMTVLNDPACNDGSHRDLIQNYVREIARNNFKSTITLFEKDDEIFIYDGNHSAVAFFEYYSECGLDDINLEVFIISDKTLMRIFLIRCYNFIWFTLKNRKILLRR